VSAVAEDVLDRIEAEADAAPTPRFRLLSIADVERLPKQTYLIDGVLPEGAAVMLYGAPGDGKTFLALDIALTIATGRATWFGRTVKAGRAVYVLSLIPHLTLPTNREV
jgi:RecA-family ATPase